MTPEQIAEWDELLEVQQAGEQLASQEEQRLNELEHMALGNQEN